MRPRLIAFFSVLALVLIVLLQNNDVVPFRFLFWKFGITKLVLVLATLLVGFVLGLVAARWPRAGRRDRTVGG